MKFKFFPLVLAFLFVLASGVCAALLARRDAAREASLVSGEETPGEESSSEHEESSENAGEELVDPPAAEAEKRVSFLAAGDIVLHESVFLDANLKAGGSGESGSVDSASEYDFVSMYRSVEEAIRSADISMVNQETLIAASADGVPQGYPGFTGPKAAGDALIEVGFDLVNIGNNHMLDQGSAGLRRSMEYWESKSSVEMLGAYSSRAECDEICILEKNGIKIAVLSYLGQTPGTNGYQADSALYLPYLEEELVRSQMAKAKTMADCVIVTVHWGIEGTYSLNSEQKQYAALFASLGADALIGTHPHVLQPMSWVQREGYSGGGKMLLCNSLGDFLSHTQLAGGKNALGNLLGGYVTFDIVKTGSGVVLENVQFVPTVSHYDETQPLDTGFYIYPLSEYTDELLSRFGDSKAGFTSTSELYSIVKQNIPAEFLLDIGE